MIVFQLTNFLLGIYIVRTLGGVELGNYQLFITTATFLSYFAKMGLDEKISYILPTLGGAKSKQGRQLISSALTQSLIYSSVLLVVYLLFVFSQGNITTNSYVELSAYIIYFPCFVLGLLLTSILRAEQDVILRSIFIYVLPNIFNFLFILFISYFFFSEQSSLLARSLSYFLIMCFILITIKKKYGFDSLNKLTFDKPKEVTWLLITSVAFIIESGLIAIWYGKSELNSSEFGILAVILRLSALIMLVPVAITIVAGPVLAKDPDNTKIRNKILLTNAIGVISALTFICFTAKYWLLCFGDEYVSYTNELIILTFTMGLLAATQPITSIILSLKKYKWMYIPGIAISALSVFLMHTYLDKNMWNLLFIFELTITAYSLSRILFYLKLNFLNKTPDKSKED